MKKASSSASASLFEPWDPALIGKIPLVETVLQPKVEKLHRIEVGFRTDRQGRQQMLAQEALMLTGDMNILAIEFIVQYKIKESRELSLQRRRNP